MKELKSGEYIAPVKDGWQLPENERNETANLKKLRK
jgi:hypothetical protein